MKIIIYIWLDIDIYAIKLLWKYAFLYFTCIICTPATGRLCVVKTVHIVITFLQYLHTQEAVIQPLVRMAIFCSSDIINGQCDS